MSDRLHTYHVLSAEEVASARAYFETCDDRWVSKLGLGLCASHETLRAQLAAREAELARVAELVRKAYFEGATDRLSSGRTGMVEWMKVREEYWEACITNHDLKGATHG